MLEAIRRHAQGWLAKVILALIAVTFALFGVDSYMKGGSSGGVVAEVGDTAISREELSREIQAQTDRLRETLGPQYDPAIAETADFRKRVLDGLIERKAMLQEAQKLKLYAPDSYVAAVLGQIPAFQQDGKFSQARYEAVLRQNNRTPAQFENELRQAFMLEVMTSPVALAVFPSSTSMKQIAGLVEQQREISWVDLPVSRVASEVKVTPADIERYYQANKAAFTEPEQIRTEYLVLDRAAIAARTSVSDQAVADYYAAHQNEFGEPEQRRASHILIAVDAGADAATKAKARARANELLQTLRKSPERFGELARTQSQDPGSAAQDGSLGSFGRGMMVKPFEDAVFSMKPNEIRGPVESDFGYHIIRLDGIEGGKLAPLSEVRAAVADRLRQQEVQKAFPGMAENFSNLVYENADSLAAAAKTLKLEVRQGGWMSRQTAQPPLANPRLLDALFNAESIKTKQNTEAFEVEPGVLVAARVVEHRPSRVRSLAEVGPGIETRLLVEQRRKRLTEAGEALIAALRKGEEKGLDWSAFQVVGRQPSALFDAAGSRAIFRADTSKLPAYTGFIHADGAYRIVRVTRVVDAPTNDPTLVASITSGVTQALQRADLEAMADLIKAGRKVEIKSGALDEQ